MRACIFGTGVYVFKYETDRGRGFTFAPRSTRTSQIRAIMRLLAQKRRARIQKISLIRVVELRDSVTVCSPDHEKRVNDHLGLDHLP